MQVSLTAFSEDIGHPGVNGVLYGIFVVEHAGGHRLRRHRLEEQPAPLA
ncbi:hypothetical protein SBADM41S_11312 [Streptomyces badius]